jgi:hypothetical protein
MRTKIPLLGLSACLLLAGWSESSQVHAQVVYNNASTVGESWAKGLSDVISSQGNYNLSTSQAAINMEKVRTEDIKNAKLSTDTYFQMRKDNKAFREWERGPKPTMEDLARYAAMGRPKRLSPAEFDYVTGKITWPKLLQQTSFNEERTSLDTLFVKRAQAGGITFDEQMDIRQGTNSMLSKLAAQIRDLPANYYMAAKNFIQSLAYEAQLPPHG